MKTITYLLLLFLLVPFGGEVAAAIIYPKHAEWTPPQGWVFANAKPENVLKLYEHINRRDVLRDASISEAQGLISFHVKGDLSRSERGAILVEILRRQAGIVVNGVDQDAATAAFDRELPLERSTSVVRQVIGDLGLSHKVSVKTDKTNDLSEWVKSDLGGQDWAVYVPSHELLPEVHGALDRETFALLEEHLSAALEGRDVVPLLSGISIIH